MTVITSLFFLIENTNLNPYQYTWLNSFAKMTNIEKNFEIDYWGVSGKNLQKKIIIIFMRSFIYKTIVILIGIVLLYEFTIGKQIALFKDRFDILISKEGRRDGVDKLRNEIQKAINKDRYLSKEDAILLNKFFKKIQKEINEAENN